MYKSISSKIMLIFKLTFLFLMNITLRNKTVFSIVYIYNFVINLSNEDRYDSDH